MVPMHALRRLGTIDTVWRSIKAEAARISLPFSFSLAAGAPSPASVQPDPATLSQQRANTLRQADAVQTVALYVPSREFAFDLPDFSFLLAPMEDVSDPPFRLICKERGADLLYTEFISSHGLVNSSAKCRKKL